MPPGQPVYIHAHINRILIIGMDSRDYGGQESPMVYCAVWKLEMQGNQGCDSFWVQRLENQRNVSIQSLVKLDVPALAEKLSPHSAFFFLFRPSRDWMMSIHLGEDSLFLLSLLIQILISYGDTLTDTLWNNVIYQLPGHPSAQSRWHIKVAIRVFSRASQAVLVVKNQPASAVDIKDLGLIPGLRRSPGGGHGNSFKYSCLENPMDKGSWQAVVHGATKVRHNWSYLGQHSRAQYYKVSFSSTVLSFNVLAKISQTDGTVCSTSYYSG